MTEHTRTVEENLVAVICSTANTAIHLVRVVAIADGQMHFILRKMKWTASNNVRGSEIKLQPDTAEKLARDILNNLGK